MSEVGFCLIHRTLLGHPAFRNDGESMAFAWLVLRASWKPVAVRYKGKSIRLDRGQLALSVRDFAAAIDRPKGWVERLLKRLENGTMVETHNETGVTVLTICNYDKYQADQDTRRTLGETAYETDAGHRTKKITKNKEQIDSLSSDFDEFWKQYPRKVGKGAALKAYAHIRAATKNDARGVHSGTREPGIAAASHRPKLIRTTMAKRVIFCCPDQSVSFRTQCQGQ